MVVRDELPRRPACPPTLTRVAACVLAAASLAACGESPRHDPLPAGTTVLAFGDSVTHGTGAERGEDWPARLAARTGWNVVNAGVPGDTADAARSRLAAALEAHAPELVIVGLGGNDFLQRAPAPRVKEHLREILADVRAHGAVSVLLAVPKLSLVRAAFGSLSDAPLYAELSREQGVVLVDDVLSDTLSDPALRADPIHPNAQGYRALAEGIAEALADAGLLARGP